MDDDLGHISEADKYEEMGTMGNLDQSRRSLAMVTGSRADSVAIKSQRSSSKPPVKGMPESVMKPGDSAPVVTASGKRYRTIST